MSSRLTGGVNTAVADYWRPGINGGLIIFDSLVVTLCAVDALRFVGGTGLSIISAVGVGLESVLEGESLWLIVGVLSFFVGALPMLAVLVSTLLSHGGIRPSVLKKGSSRLVAVHFGLSAVVTVFTITAMSMEVLSGWLLKGATWQYSFTSMWLSIVFLGKPMYVVFVSPIVRKFLVRFTADPRTKISEVVKEVVTEESMEH